MGRNSDKWAQQYWSVHEPTVLMFRIDREGHEILGHERTRSPRLLQRSATPNEDAADEQNPPAPRPWGGRETLFLT